MNERTFYVYILTNWNNRVLYIGVTNNLERRLCEHKNKLVDGFMKKYNVTKLVYYEHGHDAHAAISREKELKKWRREKKDKLVRTLNPQWMDLSLEWGKDFSLRSKRQRTVYRSKPRARRRVCHFEGTQCLSNPSNAARLRFLNRCAASK